MLGLSGGALCGISLVGFAHFYFRTIQTTGGRSAATFRTGLVEPKAAAWHLIRTGGPASTPRVIVSEEYWNYYPLRYLAGADLQTQVINGLGELRPEAVAAHIVKGHVWSVEFSDSESLRKLKVFLKDRHLPYTDQQVFDYAHRPVLDVIHWNAAK